jgi:6-phosphogluconolactonase (cycloisomerase 2 family)
MKHWIGSLPRLLACGIVVAFAGCGGSGYGDVPAAPRAVFAIHVNVSGLTGGGLKLQNQGADELVIDSNGAASFPTRVANGASYAVTASTDLAAPPQVCTLSRAGGVIAGADVTIDVECRLGVHSAYVANLTNAATADPGDVSQYTVAADGSLTAITPAAVPAGTGPAGVTVDPKGRFAYVANQIGSSISQYRIAADGSLSPTGTPVAVPDGRRPLGVTIDPSGRYAYVALHSFNGVAQYLVSADDGTLAPMTPAIVATADTTSMARSEASSNVAVDPAGRFAYVATASGGPPAVSQYNIGPDGQLSLMAVPTIGTGVFPSSIAISPSGQYAYVANAISRDVSQYTIGADGQLSPMNPPTTVPAPAGAVTLSVTIEPSGRYAYVATLGPAGSPVEGIFPYSISADGSLNPLPAAATPTGFTPGGFAVDPSGRYAYAVKQEFDSTILQYVIAPDGGLLPMNTAAVPTGVNPSAIAVR